ncbi:MAG: glycoside hydrolase family 9 protein, partial [Gemmatimonadaceae bacterium]
MRPVPSRDVQHALTVVTVAAITVLAAQRLVAQRLPPGEPTPATSRAVATEAPSLVVRTNQMGYLPDAPKIAVACALDSTRITTFFVRDSTGRTVLGPRAVPASGTFGPCTQTWRLDWSALRRTGYYTIVVRAPGMDISSRPVRVDAHAYADAANVLLSYMREQRSGYNPFFRDSVHTLDGIIVDDSARAGTFVPVSGGWADASDYLQYVATSATATFDMLQAYRDHPARFTDRFDARGLPGPNGVSDVLDEARHGLEWLLRMYPGNGRMYNQLGDDRDHTFLDLPTTDSSDYGWGKGKQRPVYPCT